VTNPATPALQVKDLGLRIGGATILEQVDLEIAKGAFIGVIGPNGAGKTTLFNVVSGITRPTSGTVHLDGRDVTGLSVHRRARAGLGRTFQTSSLFPQLTVRENVRIASQVALGGSLSPWRFPRPGDLATVAAEEHLAEVGLGDKADLLAGELSHGDKRKLEIAVLRATDADVILLDEPMAGVSAEDVDELVELIRSVHLEEGKTVLMVEHRMEVVIGLAQRIAVMHHGALLAFDEPAAVMANETVQTAYLGEPL